MATWSLLKRWKPRELFPPPTYNDEDDEENYEENYKKNVCDFYSDISIQFMEFF